MHGGPARYAKRAISWAVTVVVKAGRLSRRVRWLRLLTLSLSLLAIAGSLAAVGSYELANLAATGAYFAVLSALALAYCVYLSGNASAIENS
jgi:hypothetical protein